MGASNKTVEAMCMTMRHDFGLDKSEDSFSFSSGMPAQEREYLRASMAQLYEHHILPLEERIREQDTILNGVRDAAGRSNPNRPLLECVANIAREVERYREFLNTIRDAGLTAKEASEHARIALE